jgi:hypothetical protein
MQISASHGRISVPERGIHQHFAEPSTRRLRHPHVIRKVSIAIPRADPPPETASAIQKFREIRILRAIPLYISF